jgi:hypothetical protein
LNRVAVPYGRKCVEECEGNLHIGVVCVLPLPGEELKLPIIDGDYSIVV